MPIAPKDQLHYLYEYRYRIEDEPQPLTVLVPIPVMIVEQDQLEALRQAEPIAEQVAINAAMSRHYVMVSMRRLPGTHQLQGMTFARVDPEGAPDGE